MAQTVKNGAKPSRLSPRALDVIAPGKTPPASSARPIIVTNRPMIHDPMAPSQASAEAVPAAQPSRVAPLISARAAVVPDVLPALPEAKEPHMAPADGAGQPPTSAPPAVPLSEVQHAVTGVTPASPPGISPAAIPDAATPQKTDRQQAARLAEQEQVVASKQYYLPITATEQRRSIRRALIVLVIVLAAACIWLDLVLDANIVRLGPLRPLTHFFAAAVRAGVAACISIVTI